MSASGGRGVGMFGSDETTPAGPFSNCPLQMHQQRNAQAQEYRGQYRFTVGGFFHRRSFSSALPVRASSIPPDPPASGPVISVHLHTPHRTTGRAIDDATTTSEESPTCEDQRRQVTSPSGASMVSSSSFSRFAGFTLTLPRCTCRCRCSTNRGLTRTDTRESISVNTPLCMTE